MPPERLAVAVLVGLTPSVVVVLSDGREEEVIALALVEDEPVPVGVSVPVTVGRVGVKKGSVMLPEAGSLPGLEVSVVGIVNPEVVVSGVSGGTEVSGSETTCLTR